MSVQNMISSVFQKLVFASIYYEAQTHCCEENHIVTNATLLRTTEYLSF
jgi:hypothetical protein